MIFTFYHKFRVSKPLSPNGGGEMYILYKTVGLIQ